MNRKRVLIGIISLVLVIGMALPGTLAVSADQASKTGELFITNEAVISAPEETPADPSAPAEEPEIPAATPSDAEKPKEEPPVTVGTPSDAEKPKEEPSVTVGTPSNAEKPAEVKHIEGCTDDCTGENCKCPCHTLFDRLMACKTLEELFALIEETPEEELMQLSDSEAAEVEAKITALEPKPLPPVVLEETYDEPVISEIIYPTVNFDHVAPFGAPVEG